MAALATQGRSQASVGDQTIGGVVPQHGPLALRGFLEHVLQGCGCAEGGFGGPAALKPEGGRLALGGRFRHAQLKRLGFGLGQRGAQKRRTLPPARRHAVRPMPTSLSLFPQVRVFSYSRPSFWATKGESCRAEKDGRTGVSIGEQSNVGEWISTSGALKEGLWGSGDMSMTSMPGAGEDEGRGGVVIDSSIYSGLAQRPARLIEVSVDLDLTTPVAIPKQI